MKHLKKHLNSILAGTICFVLVIGILLFPDLDTKTAVVDLSEYSSVSAICEFATLKSYYHNVVMYEVDPSGFDKVFKVGYKQYWIEYSGIVEMGIDASKVKITGPDADGVVEVYVPCAEVLSVYADESTLTQPISETGWFTTISGEEKTEAFAGAQRVMRQEAENDQYLLLRARENAKLLLKQYIINTGKYMNAELTVKWVEEQ